MLFNSVHYFIFFPAVVLLYFFVPHRFRWILLLGASVYFYMAFVPIYILVLFFTIIVDYFSGLLIEKAHRGKKKVFMVVSIIVNVAVLFFFKYFNFFIVNISLLTNFLHWNYSVPVLSIILPIGLSFHTFQAMSYTIEVYRGKQKAERHFGIYALYVLFFPQLVAGPIERPQNLIHQFYEKHEFEITRVADGLKLILWGLFQKMVVADRIASQVDKVFSQPSLYHGLTVVLVTYFFAFQIYCDFAGYTNIARGSAKILGFELMKNFNAPYFSQSISEFWRRWHISLSSWFRDYLYIPLGGNRTIKSKTFFSILFIFLISGLWHGAGWTFIFWGILHGFYIVASDLTKKIRERMSIGNRIFRHFFKIFIVFNLVSFAWIFFRAKSLTGALLLVRNIFVGNFFSGSITGIFSIITLIIIITSILVVVISDFLSFRNNVMVHAKWCMLLRRLYIYLLIFAILTFGIFENKTFVYFQF